MRPAELAKWSERFPTVNFDFAPMDYTLPRRYAFRYVKVEVVSCPWEKPVIEWVKAVAETSADERNLKYWTAPNEIAARLDRVACATLRDCMQTMLEDTARQSFDEDNFRRSRREAYADMLYSLDPESAAAKIRIV